MNTFSDQLVLWVINVLIHSTVLTAVLLCVAMLFRRRAAMRYWILCCGLLLVLASPAVSALVQSRGGGWLALALPNENVPAASVAVTEQPTPANDAPMQSLPTQQVELSITPPVLDASSMEEVASAPIMSKPMMAADVPAIPSAVTPAVKDSHSPMQWLAITVTIFTIIWAVGAILLLMRMTIGWIRLAGILRRAEPITDPDYVAAFTKACASAGCHEERTPRLIASDEISGPLAAGIFAGSVVLPKRLIAESSPAELAEVLVHEIAHVVRRDPIVVLFQNLVAAIYWPHPLVRKLNRELAKAREEVCDNFVLRATEAPIYSRTLLSLAQLVQQPESIPGSVGFFASRWKLEQRVAGLLDEARDRTTFLSKRGWLMVGLSTIGLTALMCVGTITLVTASDPKDTDQASNAQTGESDENVKSLSGTVRGPDGKPLPGARVMVIRHHGANTVGITDSEIVSKATSDREGRYALEPASSSARFSNGKYLETQIVTVLATHAGFGPDEQWAADQDAEVDLQLSPLTSPIVGKVVNLEGQPIDNVRVRLLRIEKPNTDFGNLDAVDKWAELAKANPASSAVDAMGDPFGGNIGAGSVAPAVKYYPTGVRLSGVGCLEIETKTNSEGEFQLKGVGDDHLAILYLNGPGIASTLLQVVARQMDSVNTPGSDPKYHTGKTYGNTFTIAVEPSQLVRGIVRDRESREGIAGVRVELSEFAKYSLGIDGYVSAETDASGQYKLLGLPRSVSGSKGSINLGIEPPADQPYFRSNHDLPAGEGLDPVDFEINLTRGVWAEGQITDAKTGDPVPSIVGYHPYIDNSNAEGHESFTAGITSLGYREMFATDAIGKFHVPALRGKGVLRVVAANSLKYTSVLVPGTRLRKNGSVTRDKREIYHVVMPGNAVVDLEIQENDEQKQVNVQLQPLDAITLRVVDPDGVEASGFYIGGQFVKEPMSLSGRGFQFWQSLPSSASSVEVILGSESQRNRPVILIDIDRALSTVFWLNEVDADTASPLVVRLQPAAKISGHLVDSSGKDFRQIFIDSHMHANDESGGVNHFPLLGVKVSDRPGRFSQVVPSNCRFSTSLDRKEGSLTLLDQVTLAPGETLDLGTINVDVDPKTWPKPKRSAFETIGGNPMAPSSDSSKQATVADAGAKQQRISGQVVDPIGNFVANAMIAVIASRDSGQTGFETLGLGETRSDTSGRFSMSVVVTDDLYGPRLIARTDKSAIRLIDLDFERAQRDHIVQLEPPRPLRLRLVDLEGQPANELTLVWRQLLNSITLVNASPPLLKTDANGDVTIDHLADGEGVLLEVPGTDRFAPQTLGINTDDPVERPEHDATYRFNVVKVPTNEIVTIPLSPSQPFAGQVLLGDSDQPAGNVPISVWSSQQESIGSMITLDSATDDQGRFRLNPYPGVRFGIEVYPTAAMPFQSVQLRDLIWKNDELTSELTIRLPKGVIAEGQVINDTTGDPIPGVYVQYLADEKNPNRTSGFIEGWQAMVRTDKDGRFRVAALPGRGTLIAHAGKSKPYVIKSMGSREVRLGKPGGTRYYAHAFKKIDLESSIDDTEKTQIRLQPSVPLVVKISDPDGQSVSSGIYTSVLSGSESLIFYRGDLAGTIGPKTEIHGLAEGDRRAIHVWCEGKKMGATTMLIGGRKTQNIELLPAGSAKMRFVTAEATPIADQPLARFSTLQFVMTEGQDRSNVGESVDELDSDIDFYDNFNRNRRDDTSRGDTPQTDIDGNVVFSDLIPGVRYQVHYARNDEGVATEFVVEAGQQLDLGDLVVDDPEESN